MPERVKDAHNHNEHKLEGLTPETVAFYEELESKFPSVVVTSGKRSASQKVGTAYNRSWHNSGQALDLRSNDPAIYSYLMNTKEGLGLLSKYGMGIIDETDPAVMKKTGAEGQHFHLGRDSKYVKLVQDRLKSFDKIQPVFAYNDKVRKVPEIVVQTDETGIVQVSNPVVIPDYVEPPQVTEFKQDLKVEEKVEQKIEESPEIKRLMEKQNERNMLLEAFNSANQTQPIQQRQQTPQYEIPIQPINIDIQTPQGSIFQFQ